MVLSWVRRGLRTGILTTRYPATKEYMPEGFHGRPVLDANRCLADQGCKACVQVCLPAALSIIEVLNEANREPEEGEAWQLTLDYARCIMCKLCVTSCPADALRMTEDYELASSNREDLRLVTLFAATMGEDDINGKEKRNDGRFA
jgi:hydrogenase-4 component H